MTRSGTTPLPSRPRRRAAGAALITTLITTLAAPRTVAQQEPAPDKLLMRTKADIEALFAELQANAHAFVGQVGNSDDDDGADGGQGEFVYSGARHGDLAMHRCEPWTVLTRGKKQLTRSADGPWTVPQGDEPDCPLSLLRLAEHLPAARVVTVAPGTHDDRPAMLAHLVFADAAAAAALVDRLTVPNGKVQRVLETVPRMLQRWPAERWLVDSSVTFDPAQKQLLAATLRVALLSPDELPPEKESLPGPEGLPGLRRHPLLQFVYKLTRRPVATVPLPALSAADQSRLDAAPPASRHP